MQMAKGEIPCELTVEDLCDCLKGYGETAEVYDKKLQIDWDLPNERWYVEMNSSYLSIAFRQIFRNCKTVPGEDVKRCRVRGRALNQFVEIQIQDSGPGFDKDDLGSGWRAVAALQRRAPEKRGGMGLVICNAVVELHHGEMSLGNHKNGGASSGGAQVKLRFPLQQASV
jgi:K+-sensing histidine kinase KdpD